MKKILLLLVLGIKFNCLFAQNFNWVKGMGSTGDDVALATTNDASNNIYTTGVFNGTVDFDPSAGVYNLTASGVQSAFISKLDALGNFIWARAINGTGSASGYGIVTNASGDVYITGGFGGTMDFDLDTGVYNLTAVGNSDIFVAKINSAGALVWAKKFGVSSWNYGYGITLDPSGNVLTTGDYIGTVDFDPGAGTAYLSSAGQSDVFVSKLDANGNYIWAKGFGSVVGGDVGNAITTDASGDVYTTGSYQDTADFDPGAGVFMLGSSPNGDIFISKLDVNGNFVWAKSFGDFNIEEGKAITTDASGVYTTGYFSGKIDFDTGAGIDTLTGTQSVFITKYDFAGNYIWTRSMTGVCTAKAIKIDGSGKIYTTGSFYSNVDFDPGAATYNLTSAGSNDIFISILDASGNFVSAIAMGGSGDDAANSLCIDNAGNVAYAGYFSLTADFDPSAAVVNLASAGGKDIFISKLATALAPNAGFAISSPVNTNMSCFGTQLTFNDTSSNTPTSWSWNFGDGQTSSLQNPTHNYAAVGNYTITFVAANANGGDTAFFNLTVNALPSVVISGASPINLCVGNSSSISASGATTYLWTPSIGLSNTTGPSVTASPTSTIQYTVTGTSSAGCAASDSVLVNILQLPIANFSYSDTCVGVSINFTDNSTVGGGTIATWMWDFGDGATSTITNPSHSYSAAGTYNVQLNIATSNGCTGFFSNNIAINNCITPITVTSPNGGEFLMQGSSVPVTWNFGLMSMVVVEYSIDSGATWNFVSTYSGMGNTINWTVPITPSTTCLIRVRQSANAANFDISDAFFTITSPLSASATKTNASCVGICDGTATANATGGVPPYTYSWNSVPVQTTLMANGLCAGNYTLTVTDSLNATANYNIAINDPAPVVSSFTAGNFCLNSTYGLVNISTNATSYYWDFGDTTTAIVPNPYIGYYFPGVKNIMLVASNGACSDTSFQSITVYGVPQLTAIPSVNTICIGSGATVTLTATGASTYSWSSGSNGPVADVNPLTTTTYSVVGTDANSCKDTAFVTVNVNPIQSLYSGNVFFKDNGTPIDVTSGKVYIYNVDSVGWIGATDSATIGAGGSFNMGTVPFGNYKVYITPNQTTFPFLANTYFNMEYTWDSAAVVSFTCADTTYMQIELDSISPLPTVGGVTLGGVIIADSTFTGKVAVQGDPIPGVDVALEQNPGSIMLATTTTNSNGHYTFNNVPLTPSGFHYTIIANIPGFGLDSSYNLVVTSAETELNYFVSDSTIYIDSALSATYASVKHIDKINESTDFKVYPNPYKNGTNINFELKEKSVVQLEIYNALGEKVAVLENTTKDAGIYKYSFSAKAIGYSTGIYFAKLRINNSLSVAKLMEVE